MSAGSDARLGGAGPHEQEPNFFSVWSLCVTLRIDFEAP